MKVIPCILLHLRQFQKRIFITFNYFTCHWTHYKTYPVNTYSLADIVVLVCLLLFCSWCCWRNNIPISYVLLYSWLVPSLHISLFIVHNKLEIEIIYNQTLEWYNVMCHATLVIKIQFNNILLTSQLKGIYLWTSFITKHDMAKSTRIVYTISSL